VIALEMCGICGTDKHTYRGETTQYGGTPAEQSTPFPIIPGHEIVGRSPRSAAAPAASSNITARN
jgi:D-arabinose 1-dehydrogenase-like Zn-dependent alcohol dehydrogenase